MSKKRRIRDPHASREAEKYERPVPSREFIIDFLEASVGPKTHEEICEELGLTDEEDVEAIRRRLRAMVRDGQLADNRQGEYGPLSRMNLIKGKVVGHPDGFGFVLVPGGDDVFLSGRQMRRVFSGDEVLVRIVGADKRGRPEGSIVDVLEHKTTQVVGAYFIESGVHFVRPDNPRISQDVIIPPAQESVLKPQRGQIVVAEIVTQPSRHNPPSGRIVEILGAHRDPGIEIEIAIRNYGIPNEWSPDIDRDLKKVPDEVEAGETEHRVDLRHLPFVTIDGEDAKDFDDAVYCEARRGSWRRKGGWKLYVAIADVSHYVKVGSALDQEAWRRGNSVYFPGFVVPMLPEKLSNGICSLNPEVDRLVMVCEVDISTEGEIVGYQFMEAVIRSRARLTYTQVAGMIAERGEADSPVRERFSAVVEDVDRLYDLFKALLHARQERGALDFETVETRILFDAQRKIEQIVPSERTDAHRLIEECMLSANVCAAQLLESSKLPALYRVHDRPSAEKLTNLREFLGELGFHLRGGEKPTPLDMQEVLERIAERPDYHIIQSVMLRSMMQAVYSPENIGHFGLNYEAYTHFTSPIRRYPDLLVHRAIRSLIRSKRRVKGLTRIKGAPLLDKSTIYPYDEAAIEGAGQNCSSTERRADEATRDVVNWLKCEYLESRVGEEFIGTVSAVTSFGLFVELDELYVEGLIHITGLPRDYYRHEAAHHRLVGDRTRKVFRLGDRLRVRVVRVDLEERKVDFELIGEESGGRRRRKPAEDGADEPSSQPRQPRKRPRRGSEGSKAPSRGGSSVNAKGGAKDGSGQGARGAAGSRRDSGSRSGGGRKRKSG